MSTLSDVIMHDHRELEEYYDNILKASSPDEKVRCQNQFTWELARHSVGEEIVVYPVLQKQVSGGQQLADRDRAEHAKAKELLKKFQNMKPSDPDFDFTIETLFNALKEHIKDEEQDDLPKLEEVLSREDSKSLASDFERTKKFVPTRSHPSAPDKPPFETAMGLLVAPIDKLGDMLRRFPKE
ncbi:hypothetical protein EHS25_004712 [Saitozyma podzolica]|uniref:Hemerythrin-like domain-containing protein n=1 Tax=Saitozyma podzolica TaxID=1890683 RepID=A0A427YV42_9TREE|nr:hypothetical protein EHS25_004712 [Saitozyma podzolica]